VFAPTVYWLWGRWTYSVFTNGHGIFVPFLIAYLVREQLKQETDPTAQASAWGFAFLAVGLAARALDSAIQTELLSAVGLVLTLPGIALLLLGARRTRDIVFPLALALFMIPLPAGALSRFFMVLRTITAIAASHIVPLAGIPIDREATHLLIPNQVVEVADNCSGYSTLYAAILTALILAHLSRSPRRRVAVLLAAVPLALICNFFRVSALVLLVHFFGPQMLDTWLHPASGLALFAIVILALFAIAGRDSLAAAPGDSRVALSARYGWGLAALACLALVPVVVHSYVGLKTDDCANPQALVPANAGGVVPGEADAQSNFDAYQWRTGQLAPTAGAPPMTYVVVRSFDAKQLYYRGSRRIWRDVEPGRDELVFIDDDGDKLPVVRSSLSDANSEDKHTLIAGLLVYRGRPVENGWLAQLRAAPLQALTGKRPMTLYAVRATVSDGNREAAEKRAYAWLRESYHFYQAICQRQSAPNGSFSK
jgi:exosortase